MGHLYIKWSILKPEKFHFIRSLLDDHLEHYQMLLFKLSDHLRNSLVQLPRVQDQLEHFNVNLIFNFGQMYTLLGWSRFYTQDMMG